MKQVLYLSQKLVTFRKRHIVSAIKSFRPSRLKMEISPIGFVLIMQALKQIFGRLWQFCSVVCGNLPTRLLVKQASAD